MDLLNGVTKTGEESVGYRIDLGHINKLHARCFACSLEDDAQLDIVWFDDQITGSSNIKQWQINFFLEVGIDKNRGHCVGMNAQQGLSSVRGIITTNAEDCVNETQLIGLPLW